MVLLIHSDAEFFFTLITINMDAPIDDNTILIMASAVQGLRISLSSPSQWFVQNENDCATTEKAD